MMTNKNEKTETKRKRKPMKKLDAKQIVADFKAGMSHSEIARKYGLHRPSVSNLISREIGFIESARIQRKKIRKSVKTRYEDNFMLIAQSIVDRIGATSLAKRLKISRDMLGPLKRDIISDEAYFQLTHPKIGCETAEERINAIREARKKGWTIRKIVKTFHVSTKTVMQICKENQ